MTELLRQIMKTLTGPAPMMDRLRETLVFLRQVVPYDAAAVLQKQGGDLVPLVTVGLVPELLGRRFTVLDEPRLKVGLDAEKPLRFDPDCALQDPYDGLLLTDKTATAQVHACWIVPLRADDKAIGVLTLDAQDSQALDSVDSDFLELVGSLIANAVQTWTNAESMQAQLARQQVVAHFVRKDMGERLGDEFLGISSAAQRIRSEITMVAKVDLPVLISGETGTGKEVVARAIHGQSARSHKVMLHLNCAALPESIAEDELFGHARGSFTGAERERLGKFEAADGGTLFLDEIGELPLTLQPKLLRVLESGEIQRVGADKTRHVDVRIIAATNRDLTAEVDAGRFRSDLYHRLVVFPLFIPPLRERSDDIDLYCGYFLDQTRLRLGTGPLRLDSGARQALHDYSWPGNVRELQHVLLRAALSAAKSTKRGETVVIPAQILSLPTSPLVEPNVTKSPVSGPFIPTGSLRDATETFQREMIVGCLSRHEGNWSAAARELELDRANLRRLAQRLGIQIN